jgi:PAS domain S-box-containing protein
MVFDAAWLAYTGTTTGGLPDGGWEAVHPDDREGLRAIREDHSARRAPYQTEYRLRRADGAYRRVREDGAPTRDEGGGVSGFQATCLDIHECSAPWLSAPELDFFEMSLDNLCVTGFDGYFKRVNPSWARTLGWTANELLVRPVVDIMHPEDRAATLAKRRRLHEGKEMGHLENRYLCKDGSYRWFEWRSVARVEHGLVYAAARDITDKKRAEEELRQAKETQAELQRRLLLADRLASVGTLAAGAAHEINNPLTYVLTNLSLILEGLEAPGGAARVQELVEMAKDARAGAERISRIVQGLETFSRVQELRRTRVDVRAVLEQAIELTSHELLRRARLVRKLGEVPLVEADDGRLGQVFIHLLVNAAQALPPVGTSPREIRLTTFTDGDGRAVIEVRDSGPGIPPDLLDRIFDPFFTTKPVGVGSGLGLSICHNLVSGMGGELSVTSEPGQGTAVRVSLPGSLPRAGAASDAA